MQLIIFQLSTLRVYKNYPTNQVVKFHTAALCGRRLFFRDPSCDYSIRSHFSCPILYPQSLWRDLTNTPDFMDHA